MKTFLQRLYFYYTEAKFELDYTLGKYLCGKVAYEQWRTYMFDTYPDKYENELMYIKEKLERYMAQRYRQIKQQQAA